MLERGGIKLFRHCSRHSHDPGGKSIAVCQFLRLKRTPDYFQRSSGNRFCIASQHRCAGGIQFQRCKLFNIVERTFKTVQMTAFSYGCPRMANCIDPPFSRWTGAEIGKGNGKYCRISIFSGGSRPFPFSVPTLLRAPGIARHPDTEPSIPAGAVDIEYVLTCFLIGRGDHQLDRIVAPDLRIELCHIAFDPVHFRFAATERRIQKFSVISHLK